MKIYPIDIEGHAFLNGLVIGMVLGVCIAALIVVVCIGLL